MTSRPFAVLPGALIATMCLTACGVDRPQVESGYVDVDGGQLYYESAGRGDPVILIHGGYLDARMWDGQFEAFARDHRVIRYDVRAHGRSHADARAFADHEDLHRLMMALEVPQATLIGLSMGGVIAIDFALAYPEMTRALVLVGPGVSGFPFTEDPGTQEWIAALTAAFESGGLPEASEVFTRYWCDGPTRSPDDVDPAVRSKVLDMLAGSGPRWSIWQQARQLEPPAYGRLGEIRAPTLVILGSIDMPVIGQVVDLIAERVPGARKEVIEGVAHMVNMERPDEFDRLVQEFLGELGRPRER